MESREQSLAKLSAEGCWAHERRCEHALQIAIDDLGRRILEETPILHADAQAIAQVLGQVVELARAKRPLGELAAKIRLTLYPADKPGSPRTYSRLAQLGSNRCLLSAQIGRNADFINLEITLT